MTAFDLAHLSHRPMKSKLNGVSFFYMMLQVPKYLANYACSIPGNC